MTRDLDTLLREAVATTPVDTDRVLGRARTIRRRRTAGRVAAALAAVAVLGTGLTLALDDEPVAPIVGTDPVEVEGALAPVLEATVVETSLPTLRVDVDVAAVPVVPGLGAGTRATDGTAPSVRAVGPDGTWAGAAGVAGDLEAALPEQLVVGRSGEPVASYAVDGVVALAAVLPDGGVVAGIAPDHDAPIDRLAHVEEGVLRLLDLAAPVPAGGLSPRLVVQDRDRVRFAVADEVGTWQELVVWTAAEGIRTAAALTEVPPTRATAWTLDRSAPDADRRTRVALADGLVLEVGRSDRSDAANGSTAHEQVVEGRRAVGLGWVGEETDPVTIGVVLGPGTAAAAVPVRLAADTDEWGQIANPLLSVDGALWLATDGGTGVVRVVPPGGLPEAPAADTSAVGAQRVLPMAPTPSVTPREPVAGPSVVVVPPGGQGSVPSSTIAPRPVHDAVPTGCCWRPLAVAPDGSLALSAASRGAQSRGEDLRVIAPEGTATRVATGDLYGVGVDEPSVAFDASGNLWALADRWWSHAGFPDLVVRRPGEGSFTSLGHLPLDDLLGSDAGRVHFHVEGDDVALVGTTTDAAGREVLAGRVAVAVDGAAVAATDRQAFALPGPSPAITSGSMGPHLRVGAVGDTSGASVSGPFVGSVLPAAIEHDTDFLGFPHRPDLIGGLVVADGAADDASVTTVLVGDPTGSMAGVLVAGGAEPLAAADGSVWAVVGDQLVQLLDASWRPVG